MTDTSRSTSSTVLVTPATMHRWSADQRARGRRIVLVPTMGALHEGHRALVHEARGHGDVVVVSIFVNPLQFNRIDDFDTYPRPIDDDVRQCVEAGVDAVYAPTATVMYPARFQTHVEPGVLAEALEGEHRPGHFRGVATVVSKLFNAVAPDVAVFGQKDFQQLAIIRQMVADLDMPIEIVGVPTVREADGLALSSRNRRLPPADRTAAVCISRALAEIADRAAAGEHDTAELIRVGTDIITAQPRANLEYLRIVDQQTLVDLDRLTTPAVALTAVWFGDVRLIDNRTLPAATG